MKITVVVDNTNNPQDTSLATEHGLCIYFEADGQKWLYDVGATNIYYNNAKILGVDIPLVDSLVLSHAHSDHTGGLKHFMQQNPQARIFFPRYAIGKRYTSTRHLRPKYIGPDDWAINENIGRLTLTDARAMLSESVELITPIKQKEPTPKANRHLMEESDGTNHPDRFLHEQALLIRTHNGMVILSACSHNGILNVLENCVGKSFGESLTFIGGLHLLDSTEENLYETDGELEELGSTLISRYPNLRIVTGHCTGMNAQRILSQKLGKNFMRFYTGFQMDV